MSGAATQTSPCKSPAKRGGITMLPPKQTVARKGRSKIKVSATTPAKDKRAGKPVKTCEVASTPAAEKGGQPTVLYVDIDVDTIVKNKTRVGRGKRKTPPESSVEPVKTPRTIAATVGLNKNKRVGAVKKKKKASKRNVVVTLPRQFDDNDESKYEEDKSEDDENEDDDDDEDDNEDHNEDAVQEPITDNSDKGAKNKTAGGNCKPDSGLSESEERSVGRFREMLDEAAAEDVAAEDIVREVLNRSAQKGTANPPNIHLSSLLLKISGDVLVRGMSKTESVQKRHQKHVAHQITLLVKLDVFCRNKFINSNAMFQGIPIGD
jgi:hypothetical protein